MLKKAFRKVRYAIVLLKVGGPKVFFRQLKRQLYSRAVYSGLEKNLETDIVRVPSRVEYSLRLATEEDMEEIYQKAKTEGKASVLDLIQIKWFYESAFAKCYVARTADTNELCHIKGLVSSQENNRISRDFRSRLPRMSGNELLVEIAFTPEKYRGSRISSSVAGELWEMAKRDGVKRMITYVDQDNVAQLKSCERTGYKKFEEVHELRLLSFTIRKYS